MAQLTVQQFQVMKDKEGQVKKDRYGNTQMMIKFAESPETAYKAVKDPATITEGKVMYGTVQEGQFGFRFVADPFDQNSTPAPNQPYAQPQQVALSVADNSEIIKRLDALYKAVTGEDYSEVKKETTSTDTPPVESYDELPEPDFGG